jgi:hypothetical protein
MALTPSPTKALPLSTPPQPRPRGRPQQLFGEASSKTKKRRTKSLVRKTSQEELVFATKTSLLRMGRRSAAELVSQATEFSPGRALRIKKTVQKVNAADPIVPYSDDEALAFMIDARLTKESYIMTRVGAKERGADIYPSYIRIMEAKKRCYPADISVNNYGKIYI